MPCLHHVTTDRSRYVPTFITNTVETRHCLVSFSLSRTGRGLSLRILQIRQRQGNALSLPYFRGQVATCPYVYCNYGRDKAMPCLCHVHVDRSRAVPTYITNTTKTRQYLVSTVFSKSKLITNS